MDPDVYAQVERNLKNANLTAGIRQWETHEYEGVSFMLDVSKETLDEIKTLQIRDDDVFIVTYPKAGTTWTQEIMSCVLQDGNMDKINKQHSALRVPFLEISYRAAHSEEDCIQPLQVVPKMSSPRLIKSHLPGQLLPPQIWKKKIKMVYVIRNPKDLATSYFHHHKLFEPDKMFTWDEYFERFYIGSISYGKWWDHYLYFWQRRNEDHILLLRFEDMKKDLRGTVKKISEFLGKSFSDEIIDIITDHCTFENMKKNPMTNPDSLFKETENGSELPEGASFMREGKVGSWKAQLSESQGEALESQCKEKLAGSGLTFDF